MTHCCEFSKAFESLTKKMVDETKRAELNWRDSRKLEAENERLMKVLSAASLVVACDRDGMFIPNSEYACDRMGELHEAVAEAQKTPHASGKE